MTNLISIPDSPSIDGLKFRRFRGEADYPEMVRVLNICKQADQIPEMDTVEQIANAYNHLTNCDPDHDMVMIEVNDRLVGYTRLWWGTEVNSDHIYFHVTFLDPQFRRKGIGQAMLRWSERRLREIASSHPPHSKRMFQTFSAPHEAGKHALMQKEGYQPVRYGYLMVRPNLADIPDLPLPEGLEIRPVKDDQLRAIWNAAQEAFRDHWGYVDRGEEGYQSFIKSVEYAPDIWKVAWDIKTNEVAGMVLGFINRDENQKFNRLRGWTENISVRRPWRKRGLASALIAANLRELKTRGMTEAALGVDTQNLTGALRVYERMGFQPVEKFTTYRKEL
jgi:GNAT superfamily N-acetyltransferase